MIGIVNFGLGNIHAFANIYKRLGIEAQITSDPETLRQSQKIILPGVGAFDWAMNRLEQSGLRDVLQEMVVRQGVPVLGICVGMQMMAKRSEEGELDGLGWIDAEVNRFVTEPHSHAIQLPQMGWNDVRARGGDDLFKGLEDDARFYFLHSYYFVPRNDDQVIAVTDYYGEYASAVRFRNVFGVQFHPEKSHGWGMRLLKNFADC